MTSKVKKPPLDVNKLPLEGEGGLFPILGTIPDPRKARGIRHGVQSILAIAVCAVLAGARSFIAIAEWSDDQSQEILEKLGLQRALPPCESTIRRVLQSVDAEDLDRRTGAWMAQQVPLRESALSLDGKTLCGSSNGEQGAVHLLSAIVHGYGTVVAQVEVGEKTNEIPCVKPLLADLDIRGTVVTADALHTQRETARYLVEDKGADYVFTVKDNQPTLRQDIEILHLDADPPQHTTFDKDHGRIEQRDIWTSTALNEYLDFPYVGQVFLIKRTTTNLVGGIVDGRKTTEEFVVGVTSLSEEKANPVRLLELNRGEWEIENRLHYVRDTTYDEDRSQIRTGNAPQVMAGIRNLSISLLRLAGAECIAVATRYLSRRLELPLRLIGLSGTG